MTEPLHAIEIDLEPALAWLSYSLGQGDIISPKVLELIRKHDGRAYVFAPEGTGRAQLYDLEYGEINTSESIALEALSLRLNTLVERDAACVVLEDELSLRSDPTPDMGGLPTAFVGERVLHWAELNKGTQEALRVLYLGSHGRPLNAFVTTASAHELGLSNNATLTHDIADLVAGSMIAVIVAAYDTESFLIWEPIAAEDGKLSR